MNNTAELENTEMQEQVVQNNYDKDSVMAYLSEQMSKAKEQQPNSWETNQICTDISNFCYDMPLVPETILVMIDCQKELGKELKECFGEYSASPIATGLYSSIRDMESESCRNFTAKNVVEDKELFNEFMIKPALLQSGCYRDDFMIDIPENIVEAYAKKDVCFVGDILCDKNFVPIFKTEYTEDYDNTYVLNKDNLNNYVLKAIDTIDKYDIDSNIWSNAKAVISSFERMVEKEEMSLENKEKCLCMIADSDLNEKKQDAFEVIRNSIAEQSREKIQDIFSDLEFYVENLRNDEYGLFSRTPANVNIEEALNEIQEFKESSMEYVDESGERVTDLFGLEDEDYDIDDEEYDLDNAWRTDYDNFPDYFFDRD